MDMDSKYIEQLLERYWQCDTSLEEEAKLRSYFQQGNIPSHLLRYKKLFVYQKEQQEICLNEDFDRKILSRINSSVVKARRMTLFIRFMPLLKAAAVVAMMFSIGTVMRHTVFSDNGKVIMPDTVGRQITTPSVAFSDEDKQEQQLPDSLKQAEPRKETIKR